MDERTDTVELGQVTLLRGLDLLEERISFGGQYFEHGEEAMAKTLIGFQRDSDHFIEIVVMDESLTTVRAGVGVTDQSYEEQVELASYDAVRLMVRAYFERPRDFGVYWLELKGRKRFS